MSEWQPIETAPKDGSYFIGARFDRTALERVADARWISREEAENSYIDLDDDGDDGDDGAFIDWRDDCLLLTHWQPLNDPVQS